MTQRHIQWLVVAAHSSYVLWAAWMVNSLAGHPLAQAPWFLLMLPDLPATIVLFLSWQLIPESMDGAGYLANVWLPLLLYGTLGNLQWWFLAGGAKWKKRTS